MFSSCIIALVANEKQEVALLRQNYISTDYYENDPVIKEAVDFIVSDELVKHGNAERLERLYNELINKDWFMTLIDLKRIHCC